MELSGRRYPIGIQNFEQLRMVSLTLAPKALQRSRARFHHITPCPENSQPKSGEQKG